MFDVVMALSTSKSAVPSAGEAIGHSILLIVVVLSSGITMHVLAKKSKTGLGMSHLWGVRTKFTMTDSEVFAYANRKVWKYVYFTAIISYIEAILLFLIFLTVVVMDESVLSIVGNALIISIFVWAAITTGIAIYSGNVANKAAKDFINDRENKRA